MDNSIYSPPMANLDNTVSASPEAYYIVSQRKFLIMSIATFGLYFLYWHYQNWSAIKRKEASDIWPVPRAIFSIFYISSLLSHVEQRLTEKRIVFAWRPEFLGAQIIGCMIVGHILDRLSAKDIGSPWTDIASIVFIFVKVYLLLQAQKAINVASGDAEGLANSNITGANMAWIFSFWILVGLSIFIVLNPEILI